MVKSSAIRHAPQGNLQDCTPVLGTKYLEIELDTTYMLLRKPVLTGKRDVLAYGTREKENTIRGTDR